MLSCKAVKSIEQTDNRRYCEENHNVETGKVTERQRLELLPRHQVNSLRSFTSEVIELPNDGQIGIMASRRFGKHVNLSRDKDEVAIMFDHDDMIRIHVEAQQKSKTQNVIQSCGARIPHGPVALDMFVSVIMFFYAFLLVLLVAQVRKEWKYLSILMLWFFYIILRVNTFNTLGARVSILKRKMWHFSGVSFSTIFMYFTLVIVFPMLTRDAYYGEPTTDTEDRPSTLFIMSVLKASIGFALLGMAARRSFHCGKIISHMDIITSLLLGNVDIFNLAEILGQQENSEILPLIPKGSAMEICILIACEIAFLIIVLEALMPYSLITLDKENVGKLKHNMSVKQTKEQAIVMVYPYSLFVQNVPFLIIRVLLFVFYDTLQVAFVIKNITSIVLGMLTLIRAKSSLNKEKDIKFSETVLTHRRVSV